MCRWTAQSMIPTNTTKAVYPWRWSQECTASVVGRRSASCAALLMPIVWEEPFGIVMAEALACGTPVLGFRRGSVPEVVDEGVTGFISDDADGMVASVARLGAIDRRRCREAAEARFSDASIVHNYEAVYRQLGRRAPLAATAQAG